MKHALASFTMLLIAILCAGMIAWAQVPMTGAGLGIPVASGGGVTGWCGAIPQTGLVNCWPFDSTYTTTSVATDPIGGKSATLTNVTLNGSGPSSNLNNAGVFNGTSSNGVTTLVNVPTATFSLVIWLNSPLVLNNRPIANCHTDSDNNGIKLTYFGSGEFLFYIGNGTSNKAAVSNVVTANTWNMFTWTYDGTTLTNYTGTSVGGTNTMAGPLTNCVTDIAFGYNPAYSGDWYSGKIAGVAIYNTSLSSGQVATINGL